MSAFSRFLITLALWVIPTALAAQELVLTFGGDVNFARSRPPLGHASPQGGRTHAG